MKQIEFKTNKGTFILVDIPNNRIEEMVCGQYMIDTASSMHYKLSDITEEQAINIVDKVMNGQHFQNYNYKCITDRWVKTAIESLHSLIKSKRVHLYQNPYENSTYLNSSFFSMQEDFNKEKEAESKTFYNPYIFKIVE